jgi:hypothetical protein
VTHLHKTVAVNVAVEGLIEVGITACTVFRFSDVCKVKPRFRRAGGRATSVKCKIRSIYVMQKCIIYLFDINLECMSYCYNG